MKKAVFFFLVVVLSGSAYAQFDSLNVRFVGNWPFGSGSAVAYDESRDLVFFGSGGGVYVLDAMVPDNPTKSSEALHTQGVVTGLFYDTLDEWLYIAAEKAGFEIWDVSDIINPKKLGCCYIAVDVLDVFVSDHFAYVTNGEDYGIAPGISIWDVSDPSDPEYVGFFYFVRDYDVYVSGSYAYVVGEYDFRVIDVSNPWEPQEIGSCPIPGRIVSVSGSYAYVIDYYGLRIIAVTTHPAMLISCLAQVHTSTLLTGEGWIRPDTVGPSLPFGCWISQRPRPLRRLATI
jgi:hypothetical protein